MPDIYQGQRGEKNLGIRGKNFPIYLIEILLSCSGIPQIPLQHALSCQ